MQYVAQMIPRFDAGIGTPGTRPEGGESKRSADKPGTRPEGGESKRSADKIGHLWIDTAN